MIDDPLTEKIIDCAFKVYNTLGAGFLESVYKKAMAIELHKAARPFIIEAPIDVFYDGTIIGSFFADIIVNGRVILELKAVEAIGKAHEVQLVNYLKATNTSIGLIITSAPGHFVQTQVPRLHAPKTPDRMTGQTGKSLWLRKRREEEREVNKAKRKAAHSPNPKLLPVNPVPSCYPVEHKTCTTYVPSVTKEAILLCYSPLHL